MSEKDLIKYAIGAFVLYNIINPPRFVSSRVISIYEKSETKSLEDLKALNRWYLSKYMWANVLGKSKFKFYGVEYKLKNK